MSEETAKKSTLETKFITNWQKRYPDIPLEFGKTGSLQIVGVKGTRSQVDFYHLESKVLIELHGATFNGRSGAHSSGTGIRRDATKALVAQVFGWKLFTLDNFMATDKVCLDAIAATIRQQPLAPSFTAWETWKHLYPKSKTKKVGKIKSSVV